ncbi:MAG: Dabb family protein [Leadbetterella sp.]|nr:Dabb family protein [Leadbetterella sp.]
MKRRNFVGSLALSGGGLATLQACSKESNVPEIKGIVHYVLFWLREDLTEEEEENFTDFFEELKRIPGIKSLSYGKPAATNPRPVVDNSFSYNLVVLFDSLKDVGVYENHPIHLEAIKKFSGFWTKVVVHDSTV